MSKKNLSSNLMVAVIVLLVVSALVACQSAPTPAATAAPAAKAPAAPTAAPPAATQAAPTAAPPAATQAAPATSVPAATETLKFGASLALTGPYAVSFVQVKSIFEMAVDDINAKGPINIAGKNYKLELISYDDKFTSDGALDVANNLVLRDKVKFILGPAGGMPLATQPVTEPNNVMQFVWSTIDAALGPKHPLTLAGGSANSRMAVTPIWEWVAKNRPEVKNVGLMIQDDPNAKDERALTEEFLKKYGMTVAFVELFPPTTKDFDPLIVRMKAKPFDALYIGPMPSSQLYAPFAKSLQAAGNTKLIIGSRGNTAGISPAGSAAEGLLFGNLPVIDSPNYPAAELPIAKRVIAKYGDNACLSCVQTYDLVPVLVQGIQKAGTVDDAVKVAQTLTAGEWDSTYGSKVRFGGTQTYGSPSFLGTPVQLNRVTNGKVELISSVVTHLP